MYLAGGRPNDPRTGQPLGDASDRGIKREVPRQPPGPPPQLRASSRSLVAKARGSAGGFCHAGMFPRAQESGKHRFLIVCVRHP